jgi:peptidoglycan/LPS O-acetylase OafA/YrhL
VAQAGLRYEAIWCNTFARLDPLAAGALLALALQAKPEGLGRARPLAAVLALLLWALVARTAGLVPAPRPLGAVLGYLGQALASALAVAAVLSPSPSWLAARPLTYLGKISYGLYVFHGPALVGATSLLRHHEGHRRLLTAALGLTLTIVAASLSYALFESRFLRYKRRLARVPSGAPG